VLVLQMQLMLKWMPSRNLLIWTSKSWNYSSSGVRLTTVLFCAYVIYHSLLQ
jgi:hypothetical protein